jgi:hypothetical protein
MSLPPLFSGVRYLEVLDASLPEEIAVLSPDSSMPGLPDTAMISKPTKAHLKHLKLPAVNEINEPGTSEIKLPAVNNSLSRKFTSGLADILSPVTDILGQVLPYASTAFRAYTLIGSFFKKKPEENTLPPLPYGKNFGLIEYNLNGRDYRFSADLIISEEHKRNMQLFTHPIENGTEIVDHIIAEPKVITVILLLSNFSIQRPGDDYVQNYSEGAYEVLEIVQENNCVCSFQSSVKKYRNYVIEELSFTRDKDTGNAMKVFLSFKELTIAKSDTVIVDVLVNISNKDINMSILGNSANTGSISVEELSIGRF